ncbi:hypothetical protein GCM10027169_18870 [Gordonia jinhuaensis]|uniref:DUF3558 domain-containing protein n=1 Tax=Gordonia jinhuaensis TaxID=1517702 RepID=A0A916THX5_9ACTN|nr:hypothetical protein GCM10011489_36820 [Gordonia jinhuaensis]
MNVNSTKDLSTVTATIDGEHSPYADSLPNICPRFPDSALIKAGLDPQMGRNPLSGKTTGLLQSCSLAASDPSGREFQLWSVAVGITSQNIRQIIDQSQIHVIRSNVSIGPHSAYMFHSDGDGPLECSVAWGTFFGSVMIDFNGEEWDPIDPCAKVVDVAKVLYPYIPARPSEMR